MRTRLSLVVLPLLLAASPLAAQTVRGELVNEAARPIAGAFVALRDSTGTVVDRALTGDDGRFLLSAPAPGSYTLASERIGYAAVVSPPLRLAAGAELGYRLRAASTAVVLDRIVVGASRRCDVRPAEGRDAAILWDEVRKALEASAWTEARRAVHVRISQYERDLDPAGREVLAEERTETTGASQRPVLSIPAEELARTGFRRNDGNGIWYHAPDANVLLSDPFLDTHCFRVVPGDGPNAGMVGLAFQPVRRNSNPEVAGTLWLDTATRELSHLEYRYVRLPRAEDQPGVGGRVDFLRLGDGTWIVRQWEIRGPRLVLRRSGLGAMEDEPQLAGLRAMGGEVLEVTDGRGRRLVLEPRGAIAATVVDAVTGEPLAGAEVIVRGTQHRAPTDSAGRAFLPGLARGTYGVLFAHPRLDSLSYTPPALLVGVTSGDTATVRLAAPPLAAVLAEGCAEGADPATGPVVGVVRNAATSGPLPHARVRLRWGEGGGAGVEALADRTGRYRACGVPLGVRVAVRAEFLGEPGPETVLEPRGAGPFVYDPRVPVATRSAVVGGRAVAAAGNATVELIARVIDARSLAPLPGFRVRLEGAPFEGTTGRTGLVRFPSVPHGTYRIEITHPERGRRTEWLAVGGGESMEVELRFPAPAEAQAQGEGPGELR